MPLTDKELTEAREAFIAEYFLSSKFGGHISEVASENTGDESRLVVALNKEFRELPKRIQSELPTFYRGAWVDYQC